MVSDAVNIEVVLWFSHLLSLPAQSTACLSWIKKSVLAEWNPKSKNKLMVTQYVITDFVSQVLRWNLWSSHCGSTRCQDHQRIKRLKQTRIADALRITSREVERRIEGWPSIKGYFGEDTRIHKSLFVVQKPHFFAMKVTLPPAKDCFWEETKTNRVHFPPPSICCWLFTWHNNEKENSQIKKKINEKQTNNEPFQLNCASPEPVSLCQLKTEL